MRIDVGSKVPWWMGMVYYDFYLDQRVMLPIPLNLIGRWILGAHHWMQCAGRGRNLSWWNRREAAMRFAAESDLRIIYEKGVMRERTSGRIDAFSEIIELLKSDPTQAQVEDFCESSRREAQGSYSSIPSTSD